MSFPTNDCISRTTPRLGVDGFLAAVAAMATPPPPAGGPNMTGRTRPNSRNPQGKPYRKSLVEAPG